MSRFFIQKFNPAWDYRDLIRFGLPWDFLLKEDINMIPIVCTIVWFRLISLGDAPYEIREGFTSGKQTEIVVGMGKAIARVDELQKDVKNIVTIDCKAREVK